MRREVERNCSFSRGGSLRNRVVSKEERSDDVNILVGVTKKSLLWMTADFFITVIFAIFDNVLMSG